MNLTNEELDVLKTNSSSISEAKRKSEDVRLQISSDLTADGIFPNGDKLDFENPNIEKFKSKWCSWWSVARIVLKIAKKFTNDNIDKVIDALLDLGNSVCETQK